MELMQRKKNLPNWHVTSPALYIPLLQSAYPFIKNWQILHNLTCFQESIWLYMSLVHLIISHPAGKKNKMTNTTNAIAVITFTNRKSKQLIWSLYKHNKWYMSLREAPLSQNGWFFEFLFSLQPIVVIFIFVSFHFLSYCRFILLSVFTFISILIQCLAPLFFSLISILFLLLFSN